MIETFQHLLHSTDHFFAMVPYLGDTRSLMLYVVTFVAALFESVPILSSFAPGTLLLMFFGFVSSHPVINLALVIGVASLGGIIGDLIDYYIGRRYFKYVVKNEWALKYLKLAQGQAFFMKHGGKSILFARFIGPIRPVVPMFAGIVDMPMRKFLFWNILGSVLWAAVYILIGYFFGANLPSIAAFIKS